MKKRYFCAALAVLLMMSLLVVTVSAEEYSGTCGDNVTWTLDAATNILTVSGAGPMTDFPHEEAMPWYANKSLVHHVVIEEGVTSIGDYAFSRHRQIQTLDIADSVKTIGTSAFTEDWGIREISFGTGLTSIGKYAFSTCDGLVSITLPSSLKTIAEDVFNDCWSLEEIAISDGLTEIKRCGFRNTKITKIYIPASVTVIGEGVFHLCDSLQNVYYGGTQEQWNSISIHSGSNDSLFAANIHYEHSHSFDGGTVTRQATCSVKGVKTYTCTVCNAAKQETFSAGHSWDSGKVTAASCTVNGKTVYTCTVCKDTKEETITASGHSWDSGTQNADTTVTYACTKCSAKKTEGTPVTPTEPTEETTTPTVTDPTEGTAAVPETTPPPATGDTDATVPESSTPAPEQGEPAPAIPKKTFPWGIVIGVAAVLAVGGVATAVVLKKRKK